MIWNGCEWGGGGGACAVVLPPHFWHLDDLFALANLTMSTILFRSCWVPFRSPPFSACRRSFYPKFDQIYHYTPRNEVSGGILDSACLSVRLSVCLSVCPLTFRVRPVASTVQDGFFPYLVQMITSMRRCVACDDLWPWPISSRSFDLDLENRVRSVASTVLDGFLLYLAQMITIIRGCVACYVFFKIWKFEFLANFWNFSALTLKKKFYSSWWILSIFITNDH